MTAANIWIKICGNTSLEDALLAADAGVDAVGFVFAPSPRRVTPAKVAAIVPHLPPAIEKIGVFVDIPLEEIKSIFRATGITGVQLHFDAAPDLPAKLRAHFGPELRILRVSTLPAGPAERPIESRETRISTPCSSIRALQRPLAAPVSRSTGKQQARLCFKTLRSGDSGWWLPVV